jgi:hypothetical protein
MRRVALVFAILALLIPMAAWADTIDLTNQGGTVTFMNTPAGIEIVSKGSELTGYNGIQAPKGHALGSISFSTGAFQGSSIWQNGTFSSVGSSFDVTGVGNYGQPKGVIFAGSFIGPIEWTVVSHNHANYIFDLSGEIEGTLYNGRTVSGTTVQTIYAYTDQEPYDQKAEFISEKRK